MSLTGLRKRVRVLEEAGLLTMEKIGSEVTKRIRFEATASESSGNQKDPQPRVSWK